MSLSQTAPPPARLEWGSCDSCSRHRPLLTVALGAETFTVCGECLPPAVTHEPGSAPTE